MEKSNEVKIIGMFLVFMLAFVAIISLFPTQSTYCNKPDVAPKVAASEPAEPSIAKAEAEYYQQERELEQAKYDLQQAQLSEIWANDPTAGVVLEK